MSKYNITRTQSTVYLDSGGRPIQGFNVTVEFPAYDESHELHVPRLETETVKDAVEALLAEREALAELGKD